MLIENEESEEKRRERILRKTISMFAPVEPKVKFMNLKYNRLRKKIKNNTNIIK